MILRELFGKKQPRLPALESYRDLAVDMHSHLIPGIDDGAKTLDESISLIRQLIDLGYKRLITTPHIMADGYRNTPEGIQKGLEDVQQELKRLAIDIPISAAAEYFFDEGFFKSLAQKSLLTFGDRLVLFELSYMNRPGQLDEQIFEMRTHGYRPVLAHPERYPYFHSRELQAYRKIREQGVLLQVNIGSFTGAYGTQVKKIAEAMVDARLVDLLGTDVHKSAHIDLMAKGLALPYVRRCLLECPLKNYGLLQAA